MHENSFILISFEMAIFLAAISMHIARKNSTLILLYTFQSVAVSFMLLFVGLKEASLSLTVIAILTFLVKVIGTPKFFSRTIGKEQLNIVTSSYLSLPITLGIILALTILVKSSIFAPLVSIFPNTSQAIALALSGILSSFFLIINKRGVFPQLIGILSFENEMVAFGVLVGLEQALAIEIGILFDILLWIIIASVLVKFIYSHFGSLNTKGLNRLKD